MTTEVATAPAPAPAEALPQLPDAAAWVAERAAKRAAAAPVQGADGRFVSKNPQPAEAAPVEEAPEATQESEADTQAADESEEAPETDTLDAAEATETDPAETPTLEAPSRWDAAGKALFATLPPETQNYILAREKLQQGEITKAQQKSTEAAKAYETRAQHLKGISDRIGEYIDANEQEMREWDQWRSSPAARQLANENPAEYIAAIARYDEFKATFEKAKADKDETDRTRYAAHLAKQSEFLAEHAPELADPKEGKQRFADALKYARENTDADADSIRWISAKELRIAYKAMLWDRAQARAKEAPKPKPKPAGPTAAPAGQGQRASSSEAKLGTLQAKKTWSQDDFMKARALKRK